MDIAEDRDAAFWTGVYEHPAVKPHVGLGQELDIAAVVADPAVTPLRAAHGGFLVLKLDPLARFFEFHTLFTPEGWGREVLLASKAALRSFIERGAQVITTMEVEGHWRSQPPLSFGFRAAGPFVTVESVGKALRTWVLTRDAWDASPASRRA